MEISATLVKQLREQTGAPMMDCKKALLESTGDFEKAITYLRQKSLATVTKKASRNTSDGLIASYIHPGSKIGVMVELNCETDFVARSGDFTEFTKNVAMHIAALNPLYIRREDVSEAVVESEKSIYREQAKDSGKPEKFWDKIISGRLEKFYSEVCLLEQTYIKDDSRSIQDVLNELIAKLGENISISRFVRYQLGETVPR
jgi:elongation factor Ts